jgi:hypothetical protein
VQVGAELYSAIVQFLQLFPEFQKVPFFITGESYAGKLNIDTDQSFSCHFDDAVLLLGLTVCN